MVFIGTRNRFNEFRNEFLNDTKVNNVEDNMELYTQYVIARFVDQNHRLLTELASQIQDLSKALKKV